jgi:putative ABC transport system permease protein
MLKNHFKIVLRRLIKDRQFTFLNLIGLSVGLACTILIFLWVADELSVDKFHEKDGRIYQVMAQQQNAEGTSVAQQTPALLAEVLTKDMPEVEYASAHQGSFSGKYTLTLGDKHIKAVGVFAGKDYLNIFSFKLIEGNKDQVLADKSSMVITESLAQKLFGSTDNVIGKTIEWQHDKKFKVAGLIKDVPANSSIQFDFLMPFDVFLDANSYAREWGSSDPYTYVVLRPGANPEQFSSKIKNFIKTRVAKSKTTLFVRPYSQGYLYGKYENGVQAGGRIEYVKLFSIIALFILIIACINFMNLSTAKASRRLKEVGIKKVVGASRGALIVQFMIESMLMAVLALIVAVIIVWILIHPFNEITGKELSLRVDPYIALIIVGITLLTGLISGSYPALYLSGFDPVTVLKGKLRGSVGELWVRKGLVIFQFVLSVLFIVAVLVVYRQIDFIQSKNQGFNKDNVISFDMEGMTSENLETFLSGVSSFVSEVRSVPGVVNASSMDHGSIINDFGSTSDISWEGKKPDDIINFANAGFNYDMIETLGMQVAAGRSFSREKSSDSSEIIFNEAAIEMMGLKDPIGKVVRMWDQNRRIVGVVKNFHFQSLHESVKPFALRLEPKLTYRIAVKVKGGKESETIAQIGQLFNKYNPGYVFDYRFLDQDYQAQYLAERRVSVLSRYFSGLAILISCLGLFGLAAFTAQRRQKEIGIRKVVGASVSNVALLLSKDFLYLVLISMIIAFPLAWWIMNQWLDNFVYRINIGFDIFLIAGLSIILITLITISYQSLKAAMASPVKSLQSE